MTGAPRTLPIRLDPLPGEALDSWLEALAQRLDTPLGDVRSHLGFPVRDRSGNHLRDIPPDWTIALREHETSAVAHASGLSLAAITAMTLAHYDQRALRIDLDRRHVDRRVLWGRGRGSRFCPECLADSAGRWQLVWRLGWTFACPRHRRLLADCCPNCGRVQRERPRSGRVVPQPGICGNPPSQPSRASSGGCGFDLTETRTLRLPAGHPVLTAQDWLMEAIESGTAAFGAYTASPQLAYDALTDIRAVGGRVLADLPAGVIRHLLPADLADEHLMLDPDSRLASRAAERPGFMAPPRAVSAAVAVTIALRVLELRDLHEAGEVMRGLLEAMREELWQISATSIDSWGRGLSPVLNAVHLAALAPSFRPSDQLRFRTVTSMPSRPNLTDAVLTRRARHIPSTFWQSWAVRLTPSKGVYPRVLAPVLAGALLIIGSRTSLDDAALALGAVADGIDISRILQLLNDQQQWPDMMTALVRLADYLDSNEIPIDYQRRRRLDYTSLLPHERWLDICRRTGTLPGQGRREQIIRCRLFQRVSGLPAEAAPSYPKVDEAPFRAEIARAAALQTPELAEELDRAARDFLAAHGIHDEPVTWQPPIFLLDGLDLPGPDPARIDIPHLHQLIRQRKNPVQYAARALDTSVETIRYVLDEHPAPAPPPTKSVARAIGATRHRARQDVPKETFVRLYLHEHQSLNQIAALTGFSRKVLASFAHEYDIPLRDGPQDYKPRGTIERDWLIEQYVHCRRTLADLAREKGMSTANMARWAHTHGIPLRPRGGGSHGAALRVPDETAQMPPIVRMALTSPYARQRLDRFLAAISYPTMSDAAVALGLSQSALVTQINRLERDLGHPLLERAVRGRPMKPTAFGLRAVSEVRKLRRQKNAKVLLSEL
ncbi:TniQ family protein [Kitasatospora sp. NPDC059160]|uniref:TniQ family protein n=1 Tax=Kitasatospora sp. NPDC059160 TaxID=3346748 RepID=UPI0036C2F688